MSKRLVGSRILGSRKRRKGYKGRGYRTNNAGSGMGNIINIALFAGMAYVAYQMIIGGKTLGQTLPFLTQFGISGLGDRRATQSGLYAGLRGIGMYADGRALAAGMNGIAPTSLYGGYAPLVTSSVSTRSERMIVGSR